ncbi:MAG TPA: BTAD domain-containing putative transcriptional regulator [Thermobifida alba]|nr:BTAD domain-containing putative transcriptional regulator [Thermobifida alba]
MRFGVLGPLELWSSDGETVRVPEAKVRALLADLLVNEGRPVPADRLVDDLWGDGGLPANPVRVLRAKISQLRGVLERAEPGGRKRLLLRPSGYQLLLGADDVDAFRFGELLDRARRSADPRTRSALLADALSLWRGEALADFADREFARPAVARWQEQRLAALEEQAETRLALGEHHLLVDELRDLVDRHPFRERLRAAHMRALYRSGRQREALESFERLRLLLAGELGVDPGPELVALHRAILRQDPELAAGTPAAPAVPRPRTNLPAPATELVGRERQIDEVGALLRGGRLVTLTGPGGVGKTRLAAEVAARVDNDFPDGVWLVELGGLRPTRGTDTAGSVARVAEAVAAVVGVRDTVDGRPAERDDTPTDRLADAVRGRRTLLLLDNCEHVVEPAAALVERLLGAAPQVRFLTTSREALGLPAERVYEVPPLELPDPAEPGDGVDVRRSSAVRLFAVRATAAAPNFTLDARTAPAVAAICRRLDGLPLALELAATRVRALGVHALADRLDDRFRLLTTGKRGAPQRQRTLRAVIDWSWDLLTGPERAVLRRLAAHADGCTLEAAEAVCSGDGIAAADVADLLARLVDQSLVAVADGPDGPRYRLLESVAAYCAERLEQAGEADTVRERHTRHYAALAGQADSLLRGRDQRRWLRRLDAEHANLRSSFDAAVRRGDADLAVRMASALVWYRYLRGRLGEARRSLATALEVPGGSPAARAEAEIWLLGVDLMMQESVDPTGVLRAVLDARERFDDPEESARAEWFVGMALLGFGALGESERLVRRALAVFRTRGDRWGTAAALSTRAWQEQARGDLGRCEADGGRSLELFGDLGDRWGQLQAMPVLALLAEVAGDYGRAARLHRDGLRTAEEIGLWTEVSYRLSGLGRIAVLNGEFRRAEEFHLRARRVAAEQGDRFGESFAELGLGLGARREGRFEEAETYLRNWLERSRRGEGPAAVALGFAELGFLAEQRGDAAAALEAHTAGLAAAEATGDPRALALGLEGVAGARALAGDAALAARLLGAAAAARDSVAAPLPPAERGDVERAAGRARAALGEEAFTAEFERGRSAGSEAGLAWARQARRQERRAAECSGAVSGTPRSPSGDRPVGTVPDAATAVEPAAPGRRPGGPALSGRSVRHRPGGGPRTP